MPSIKVLAPLVFLLAALSGCAPRADRADGGKHHAMVAADSVPSPLEQKLADVETALGMFQPERWNLGDLGWEAYFDRGHLLCVRHRRPQGATDTDYYYEDDHLFAVRQTNRYDPTTDRSPARTIVSLAFFDARGALVQVTARGDGRVIRLGDRQRAWLQRQSIEMGRAVQEDALRHHRDR